MPIKYVNRIMHSLKSIGKELDKSNEVLSEIEAPIKMRQTHYQGRK